MTQEKDSEQNHKSQSRGIYLLPNLFTTAGLFAGFYSIVSAMTHHFDVAAIAIFIAMIADGLDGRVARLTNTETAFGAEYDSLSDMVAFGIAPALVIYTWSLMQLGKFGWIAAFLYAAATALRLARFNTQVENLDKNYFQGLPSPSAAGVIAGTVWLGAASHFERFFSPIPMAIVTILMAGLMVSTIRYNSFKSLDLKGKVPFITIVSVVLIITAIAMSPPEVLFSIFFGYAISGPICTLWQIRQVKRLARSNTD